MTKLRIVLMFVVLAAVPLVLSVAFVFFGSLVWHSSEYWATAPWLILAALSLTPGWMTVVAIALAVYVAKRGLRKSSLRHENLVVAAIVVAVIACTYVPFAIWSARQNSAAEQQDADEKTGRDLVLRSDVVSERVGAPSGVYANYWGRELNGKRRLIYVATRAGSQERNRVFVVVDIEPAAEGRKARIVCILSPEDYGDHPNHENLCMPTVDSSSANSP